MLDIMATRERQEDRRANTTQQERMDEAQDADDWTTAYSRVVWDFIQGKELAFDTAMTRAEALRQMKGWDLFVVKDFFKGTMHNRIPRLAESEHDPTLCSHLLKTFQVADVDAAQDGPDNNEITPLIDKIPAVGVKKVVDVVAIAMQNVPPVEGQAASAATSQDSITVATRPFTPPRSVSGEDKRKTDGYNTIATTGRFFSDSGRDYVDRPPTPMPC
jgi:hypothetical protein